MREPVQTSAVEHRSEVPAERLPPGDRPPETAVVGRVGEQLRPARVLGRPRVVLPGISSIASHLGLLSPRPHEVRVTEAALPWLLLRAARFPDVVRVQEDAAGVLCGPTTSVWSAPVYWVLSFDRVSSCGSYAVCAANPSDRSNDCGPPRSGRLRRRRCGRRPAPRNRDRLRGSREYATGRRTRRSRHRRVRGYLRDGGPHCAGADGFRCRPERCSGPRRSDDERR